MISMNIYVTSASPIASTNMDIGSGKSHLTAVQRDWMRQYAFDDRSCQITSGHVSDSSWRIASASRSLFPSQFSTWCENANMTCSITILLRLRRIGNGHLSCRDQLLEVTYKLFDIWIEVCDLLGSRGFTLFQFRYYYSCFGFHSLDIRHHFS